MKTLRTTAWLLVLSLAAALGGYSLQQHLDKPSALLDLLAPVLVLNDLEGKPQALSQWRGKLLLVNFWASWCAPCIEEMPLLIAAQKQYGAQGLQVIGPAMDEVDSVKQMATRLGINYPLMADFNQVDAAMRALDNAQGALPFSVLISRDGRILKTVLGGLSQAELQHMIETHLDDPIPAS